MVTIPVIFAPWSTKFIVVATVIGTALLIGYAIPMAISNFCEKRREERSNEVARIANDVFEKAEKERKIIEKAMEGKSSPWGLNLS